MPGVLCGLVLIRGEDWVQFWGLGGIGVFVFEGLGWGGEGRRSCWGGAGGGGEAS